MTSEKNITQDQLDRLFESMCALESPQEARAFLVDILSARELDDLAQRLQVAGLLARGQSYVSVSAQTGASSTTVSRVSKCLNGAAGGYRLVLDRIGLPKE